MAPFCNKGQPKLKTRMSYKITHVEYDFANSPYYQIFFVSRVNLLISICVSVCVEVTSMFIIEIIDVHEMCMEMKVFW